MAAVGVTFLLWFAYAIVAVEGHDSKPILRLAWSIGVGTSGVATLSVVVVVPSAIRALMGNDPYPSSPRREDA